MSVADRLAELGIQLPDAVAPAGLYRPTVQSGSLLFISGQLNVRDGELTARGIVGRDLSPDDAATAARQCAINCLATAHTALGSLDRVARVVRLSGYVASAPDFFEQPRIINSASQLFRDVFDEDGVGSRIAIGVAALPLGAAVEVDVILEVRD